MLDDRYGAIESDFQRFYQTDIEGIWTGALSVRKAARLAAWLPPEAAVYRGDSLDEKYLSQEARFLRHLFNVWVDEKDRMASVDEYVEKAGKQALKIAKAEARLALQRAREGV